jgi:hypothetical protein
MLKQVHAYHKLAHELAISRRHFRYKQDVCERNIAIIWPLIFEWHVVRCGSKNGLKKDVCLKEIGLCAQTILTILCSILNMILRD